MREDVESPEAQHEPLRVYLQYEEYLNAEQLASLVATLDDLYNVLHAGLTPEGDFPPPHESRLRLSECRTGNSILFELVDGVRLAWSAADGVLMLTSGVGVVTAMGALLIRYAKGYAEIRKTWHEGSKAKYEAEKAKRELDKADPPPPPPNLAQLPDEAKRRASVIINNFYTLNDYAPNITQVQVNGVTVIEKERLNRPR